MGSIFRQPERLDLSGHGLQRLPIHRCAGFLADHRVLVEDVDSDGVLAGNHHVEYRSIAGCSLGDILPGQAP